jgi:tRNA A37 threonylcarbamoyladenosine biosynthesis protein TsaE
VPDEFLGLDNLLAPNSMLLIEWGEKFPRLQRDQNVEITLERVGETERTIQPSNGPRIEPLESRTKGVRTIAS